MNSFLNTFKGDKYIWIIILILSLIGVLAIYSSISNLGYSKNISITSMILKHLLLLGLSFFLMWMIHNFPYQYYAGAYKILLVLGVLSLIYAHWFGSTRNEAGRWIDIPIINQTFQASDLAKLALVMYLSRTLSKNQDRLDQFKAVILPMLLVTFLICFLVFLDNFSTSIIMFLMAMIILYVGRVNLKHYLMLIISGVVIVGLMVTFILNAPDSWLKMHRRLPTAKSRIMEYLGKKPKNEIQYQVKQAYMAIGGGSILGRGPGNSHQKNFLPNAFSDYVYAIIIEEYGLLGGVVVILLYLALLYRVLLIVSRSPRTFGALVALGLALSIVIQAFSNIMVNVGMLPSTGITLPFVSMGGSSVIFFGIAMGIILSVSRSVISNDIGKAPTKDSHIDEIETFEPIVI